MLDGSILTSVKKVLGLDAAYDAFDTDIIMHINSAFGTLHQMGVGPRDPYHIEDKDAQWSAFTKNKELASVQSYVYVSVRLLFDPPQTGYGTTSMEKLKTELEWRLSVAGDWSVTNERSEK